MTAPDTSREAVEAKASFLNATPFYGLLGVVDHNSETAAMLRALLDRAEAAEREAFALAAYQCSDPIAGEYGHALCGAVQKAEAERDAARASLAIARADALRDAIDAGWRGLQEFQQTHGALELQSVGIAVQTYIEALINKDTTR